MEIPCIPCQTCPISLMTSKKVLIYLSKEKDFIALVKKSIQIMIYTCIYFSDLLKKTFLWVLIVRPTTYVFFKKYGKKC